MESWNDGIVRERLGRWKNEILEYWVRKQEETHYSITPIFQFIVILLFHCSNIPLLGGGSYEDYTQYH